MLNKIKVLPVLLAICLIIPILGKITVNADYPIFYQRYSADPTALEYNGRLYIYGSHDVYKEGAGYIINDITCISTDDMKNWTDHGEVFNATTDSSWATLSWAPSVVYRNNKFYMYYGNGAGSIGVAVSDSPTGPFKDTRSGPLVSGSTPGVNPPSGFWCFDPGAFIDDNGQAYLYFGGNGESYIRVIKLNNDMVSVNGSATSMSAPRFFEAAYMNKINGKYYFSYSTNFSQGAAKIDYMVSNSPTSGFVYKGTILDNPPQNDYNNNHQSIFSFKGNWYIAYHNRALSTQIGLPSNVRVYQRNFCVDRLYFNSDGTIQKVQPTTNGLSQLKYVNPYSTVEAESMSQNNGIQTEACSEGGRNVSFIENGDWIKITGVDFGTGAASFEARVASATSGGTIEIRLDSPNGTLVGTCQVGQTSGWQNWTTKTTTVAGATGVHDLYLKFTGGSGYLFNINWWKFNKAVGSVTRTECESLTKSGTYAGNITSPFSGVALYGNGDACYNNYTFSDSKNYTIYVRGASNNSSTAKVGVYIGGTKAGTLNFAGTTASVQNVSFYTSAGTKEVKLQVDEDNGTWDAFVDYYEMTN
ncbi:endo-1,4-beta-xylanase [Anaerocolumna cellulosilytica]|uniref:Endo-1,4-beta-xylanase n=1 Tax=Anaerocolumna cellulosilytica TaxID=433286 RepID=A0A6S6R1M4_9FIRM|nr:carbohydrate-binding protein [Anaerocolumna cellulosilytica]MBB5196705.1 arabinoxylan arabinofuranohydrolase [Anaerocolumna cellulosilytica]BCJ93967.1 endo-1,4-beta-xylanase [Anaerocolumna cellulosilytica]